MPPADVFSWARIPVIVLPGPFSLREKVRMRGRQRNKSFRLLRPLTPALSDSTELVAGRREGGKASAPLFLQVKPVQLAALQRVRPLQRRLAELVFDAVAAELRVDAVGVELRFDAGALGLARHMGRLDVEAHVG